ncbi:DUF4184 family protein [Capnocytophaga catalasegens]|uniref:DUF4184 family protein n=1 Tax=Capnocytophaga catalasegens TaxID=1004260 RepID=UPI0035A24864
MPFTFSHPAIIIPLRKYLSFTGLIIGSMSPDFEYFIRMNMKGQYGHSLIGLLYFCLPISLCICFVFHNIVKDTLINNLPYFLQKRFIVVKNFSWNNYFRKNWKIVIISICIGAFSHIFWDSFTHKTGFFVERYSFLQSSFYLFSTKIYIYKILQHLSTCIGAIVLVYFIKRLPTNEFLYHRVSKKYWILVLCITFFIVFIRFLIISFSIGICIVTTISAFFIAVLVSSFLFKKISKVSYL